MSKELMRRQSRNLLLSSLLANGVVLFICILALPFLIVTTGLANMDAPGTSGSLGLVLTLIVLGVFIYLVLAIVSISLHRAKDYANAKACSISLLILGALFAVGMFFLYV